MTTLQILPIDPSRLAYDDQARLMYDRMERSRDALECEEALRRLLSDARVAEVHVRAELSQCFTFRVRRR